jgi:Ca-activated chloride channel homolog
MKSKAALIVVIPLILSIIVCTLVRADAAIFQGSDIWGEFDNNNQQTDNTQVTPLEPPTDEDILARPPEAINLPQSTTVTVTQIITDEEHFPTVQAYVSVLDDAGNPIKTLKPEFFAITEEGISVPQPIFADPMSRAPLAVVFVVDTSTSMTEAMNLEKMALKTFIDRLGDKDEAALVSFSDVPVIEYYFTGDKTKLKDAVDELEVYGSTAAFDAIQQALELVLEVPDSRRAIVVLTDGVDNKSTNSVDAVMQFYEENAEAKNMGVTIYTLGLGVDIDPPPLTRIAERTGGRYLESPTPGELDRVYREIISQIENEYVLEFTSPHVSNLGQVVTVHVDADYYGVKGAGEAIYRIPGLGAALGRFLWPGIILTIIMTVVLIIVTYLKITRAAWITVMITPLEGKDYTVNNGYASIGSAEQNEIMIRSDPNIQPNHAALKETNDGFVAEAITRDHPIGIRSEWVKRVVLRDRDAFWLGNTMFIFREKALRTGERHPAEYPDDDLPAIDSAAWGEGASAIPTTLSIVSGALAGRSFNLTAGKTLYIGRARTAQLPATGGAQSSVTVDIPLEADQRTSRLHAAIRRDDMGCWISDFGSTNGTYVDGVRIRVETPLSRGTTVQIGDTVFRAE